MRRSRLALCCGIVLVITSLTIFEWNNSSAAAPKAATKKTNSAASQEVPPEIPAVPFLTLGLIRDTTVQSELGLDSKQIAGVQAAIAEVDEPFWQLRDIPVAKCGEQLDSLYSQLRKNLSLHLTSSQSERLDQLVLQARSWKGVARPDIAEKLKLSPQQVSRLQTLLADLPRQREETEKELASQPAAKQEMVRTKRRKAESQAFTEILTSRQQDQLSELLGKPFDLDRVTPVGVIAPELRGVTAWINTPPLSLQELRGKVVVVHFWAFGCINCIRNLPHYQSWQEKFSKSGVTIIGIQTPETDAERSLDNLKRQVLERKIEYPVAFDSESKNWKAWGNDVWPAVYLIDKKGQVRNWWYGELNWKGATGEEFIRKRIEALLAE